MIGTIIPLARKPVVAGVVFLLGAAPALAGGPNWVSRGFPPPSYFGYNLDDTTAGYYGGSRYREYYSYGRGYGLANYPGPYPGPIYPEDFRGHWNAYWSHSPHNPHNIAAVAEEDGVAYIEVQVPANAQIWLEGSQTRQTGAARLFVSPPLTAGKKYTYEVRARWLADGKEVEETQNIVIQPGTRSRVSFPTPQEEVLPKPKPFPLEGAK